MKKYSRKLYLEIWKDTNTAINPVDQENNTSINKKSTETELVEVNYKKYLEYLNYYRKHKKCKHHLVFTSIGFIYDELRCGVCGKLLRFI